MNMLRRLARGPGRGPWLALSPLLIVCLLLFGACASEPTRQPVAAIPEDARQAFARARELQEAGASADSVAIWNELARVRDLAPDWIAPARFEDDLLAAVQAAAPISRLTSVSVNDRRRLTRTTTV